MIGEKTAIWREGEYSYPAAYGFVPFIVSYMHEDDKIRPAMLVAPGGAYRYASPYEGNLPALEFYRAGYNVFVLAYTVNHLDELDAPLGMQPLQDISRAVRIIRAHSAQCNIDPLKITTLRSGSVERYCQQNGRPVPKVGAPREVVLEVLRLQREELREGGDLSVME